MIFMKERISSLEDIHAVVDEINQLTVVGGVTELLASDPVLLEQIAVINLCSEQLEPEDELLMEELMEIVTRLRAAADT